VLLAGTGDTARLTLRHLRDAGVQAMTVWSRDPARGAALAQEAGTAAAPGPIGDEGPGGPLAGADLLVTAVGDAAGLVGVAAVRAALRHRKQRPMVVIDLGVPRNVEGAVAGIDNVFHYDVDALERVVQANLRERGAEVAAAETIVADAVAAFWKRYGEPDVERSLADLATALTAVGEGEIAAMLEGLPGLPPAERERVREAARRLVNRLLHRPLRAITRAAQNGGAGGLTVAARRLFALDDAGPEETGEPPEPSPPA
jgi:glutamyl-tRNA reductase